MSSNSNDPFAASSDAGGFNPYRSTAESSEVSVSLNADATTAARELARWQTFFAVLLLLGAALMGIVILFSAIGEDAAGTIGGLICGGSAALLLYGLPALMLFRAASGARDYARSADPNLMGQLIVSQLRFWRTIGILAAIVVVVYGIGILVAVIFIPMGIGR